MFQVFTQKLASEEESKMSFGLFMELSNICTGLSVNEVFTTVLEHKLPFYSNHKRLTIHFNQPKPSPTTPYFWNPHHFPKFQKSFLKDLPINQKALNQVNSSLNQFKFYQLNILKAHILMQRYHYEESKDLVLKAIKCCSDALKQEAFCVSNQYILSLLYLLDDTTLKNQTTMDYDESIIRAMKELLENRKYSVKVLPKEIKDSGDFFESEKEEVSVIVPEEECPCEDLIQSIRSGIKKIKRLKEKGAFEVTSLINTLISASIIPDDTIIHEKYVFMQIG